MAQVQRDWIAQEWMTDIPISIRPQTSVGSAFLKMRVAGFRHLLVIENGRLLGIVTDRDLRRRDISDDIDGWKDVYQLNDDRSVSEVMTTDPITVSGEIPLLRVVALFLEFKFGALPVVDTDGRVVGILTQHDVLRATHELLARDENDD